MTQGIRTNAIQDNALTKLNKPKNPTSNKIEDFDFTQLFANALGNGKNQTEKNQLENQLIEKTNEKKPKKENKNKIDQDISNQDLSLQTWGQNANAIPAPTLHQNTNNSKQNTNAIEKQAERSDNGNNTNSLSSTASNASNEHQNDAKNPETSNQTKTSDITLKNNSLSNTQNDTQHFMQTNPNSSLSLSEPGSRLEPALQSLQISSNIPAITEDSKSIKALEQGQSITVQGQIEPSRTNDLSDIQNQNIDKTAHVLMQQAIAKGHNGIENNSIALNQSKKLSIEGIGDIRQSAGNPAQNIGQAALAGAPLVQVKTPVTSPGFVREVSHHLQTNINKNASVIDLKISPDAFGTVNMRIVQRGSELHLVVRAKDDKTADALQQSLGGLKESLAQAGIHLTQVQVTGSGNVPQNNNNNNPNSQLFNQSNLAQNSQDPSSSNHGQQRSPQNSNSNQMHSQQTENNDSIVIDKTRSNQGLSGGIDVFA